MVIKNKPTTLDCAAEGEPAPKISWFKDGESVVVGDGEDGGSKMIFPDGSLFFLEVDHSRKSQDAGVYWCTASNEEGVARSRNATLEVACKQNFICLLFIYTTCQK